MSSTTMVSLALGSMAVAIPHTGETAKSATVAVPELPGNVISRLIELGLSNHIRSAVNSARGAELDKALKAALDAHNAAEQAKKAKDAKYKPTKFDVKTFKENFVYTVDPVAVANERITKMMAGEIRAARGESGTNRLLASAVTANILTVLKSKGKGHKEAKAMVGDDPFAFIEKTARKRAGEGEGADERYKTELAKLNAQYVDPARALLAPEAPAEDGEGNEGEDGGETADDLL